MHKSIRIGTRESQLAVWQATQVKNLLADAGYQSELVYIKSEGDIDLKTPLYDIGVQGIFTRTLDIALLNNRIDLAVHSMKDVPIQLPAGIDQAAVLERGPVSDLLVLKNEGVKIEESGFVVATSSIRRKAQWLHKYPQHTIENLRGNVNTRLQKLQNENWDAAIFAQAGLERIGLRPKASIVLDWMLPAPAQGAIIVVCRSDDKDSFNACKSFNHEQSALCTKIERDFLKGLLGGCSTPISALAEIRGNNIYFRGNIFSPDGQQKQEIEKSAAIKSSHDLGKKAAIEILENGGQAIAESIKHAER
jgi:hydroxymethylbilane synthase